MSAQSLLLNFLENTRTRGLTKTLGLYGYRLRERLRERQLGIETTGVIPWDELTPEPDRHSYVAADYDSLDAIFHHLQPDGDVLLDYGCGKGRVVALAAMHPFGRVIGVELNPELIAIARNNLRRIEPKAQCKRVDVFQSDATEFKVPSDVTVIFLFNPFSGQVLLAVEEQIRASLAVFPRELRIVSIHPVERDDSLAHRDWLTVVGEFQTSRWNEVRITIYEATAINRKVDTTAAQNGEPLAP